jgi:hypothetical protein
VRSRRGLTRRADDRRSTRRQAARALDAREHPAARLGVLHACTRPVARGARRVRHSGIAARRSTRRSPSRTSSPSRRRSVSTGASQIDGPSSSASTHTPSPSRRSAARSRCSRQRVDVMIDRCGLATHRHRALHAVLTYNRDRTTRPGRRHRRDSVAQPPETEGSSTTARTAGLPTRRRRLDRAASQRDPRRRVCET